MASTARKVAIAAGGVSLVVASWLGASIQSGRMAAAELQALAGQPSGMAGLRVASAHHVGGLLASSGRLELRLDDHCDPSAAGSKLFALQVDYTLSHLLLPKSLLRFEWQVTPVGELGVALAKATGGNLRLDGQGTVSYGQEMVSTLSMPEMTVGSNRESLRLSSSSGRLTLGERSLGLEWKTDRVAANAAGKAIEVLNFGVEMNLVDRNRGTGTAALSVDRIGGGFGSIEGLRLASESAERGDRTDVTLTPSIRSVNVPGQSARELSLQIGIRDLHTASFETLSRIASESCGFKALTAEETAKLQAAVRTLLGSGMSLAISNVKGTVGEGSVEGNFKLELVKAAPLGQGDGAAIELARLLRSSGELTVKGKAVTDEQRTMALDMGVATEVAGGLRAAFEYADGLLKTNGREVEAGALRTALATADRRINTLLGVQAAAEPPASPPVAEAGPEGAPARPETGAVVVPAGTPAPQVAARQP